MSKTYVFSLLILSIYSTFCLAIPNEITTYHAKFSGRISKLNQRAALVRVKVDFENAKFLNKKDKVEFWTDTLPSRRCASYLEAKSNEYLLLKVPQYNECVSNVHLTTGAYLHFYSTDLERNLRAARELIDILLKKQLAIGARVQRYKKNLENYPDRVEALNRRYDVLRKKLELEWSEEIAKLEEDKAFTYKNFQSSQARLDEIEHKMERYRIYDHNLKLDRWSLDPKLYIKK